MSVFIELKEAELQQFQDVDQISFKVRSNDTELSVAPIGAAALVSLDCSLIASIKQKHLLFIITLHNIYQDTTNSLEAQYSFSPLHFQSETSLTQTLVFDQNTKLRLDVYYTQKKNYLGPIEFYRHENLETGSTIIQPKISKIEKFQNEFELSEIQAPLSAPRTNIFPSQTTVLNSSPDSKKPVSDRGIFFCCGDNLDENRFQVVDQQQRPVSKNNTTKTQTSFPTAQKKLQESVQFYKGACQTKNGFSCLDTGTKDGKYQLVEDYYRDKQ